MRRKSFRRIVKFILPTLHLGIARIDSCNSCFSLELQIKDPETSAELKEELIAAKALHLKDAINMRKTIKNIINSVKKEVAPEDGDLPEEPVHIPICFSDPFDRLNRPFVIDQQVGVLGRDEDVGSLDGGGFIDEEENQIEEREAPPAPRKLRVVLQDFGAGIPLPKYGADQPNHDYYASNLTLHNFNIVDCSSGHCNISYYDERTAGKDGNCVSSLRWNDAKEFFLFLENKNNPPSAECKILDNCVGQNKSNTTHKFSMLMSILVFGDGVTDVYFRVGHSHNTSDMKTAHANKAMSKKNLYTPHMVVEEINKMKGLTGRLFDDRDGMFFDWKSFLDKHFPNMDPGFTSYFLFEFKDGVVKYKEVDGDGKIVTVKTKVFCANPAATRKIILQELLNLSPTSNVFEIFKTKPRLPPLPVRRVSRKKIDNMKILYQQIPRCHRWFYPEGCDVVDDPHIELRRRAVEIIRVPVLPNEEVIGDPLLQAQDNDASDEPIVTASDEPIALQERRQGSNNKDNSQPKRKVGRPPKVKPIERNQPAIHRFLS